MIERGPKNTKPYVAIASARYALGFTIKQKPVQFPYKRFGQIFGSIEVKKELIMEKELKIS